MVGVVIHQCASASCQLSGLSQALTVFDKFVEHGPSHLTPWLVFAGSSAATVAVKAGAGTTKGNLVLQPNGAFTYTPTSTPHQADSFTYVATCNGQVGLEAAKGIRGAGVGKMIG